MKTRLVYLLPIIIGAMCFILALIDLSLTDATSYKEMNGFGKAMFLGFMLNLSFLVIISFALPIYNWIKKLFK